MYICIWNVKVWFADSTGQEEILARWESVVEGHSECWDTTDTLLGCFPGAIESVNLYLLNIKENISSNDQCREVVVKFAISFPKVAYYRYWFCISRTCRWNKMEREQNTGAKIVSFSPQVQHHGHGEILASISWRLCLLRSTTHRCLCLRVHASLEADSMRCQIKRRQGERESWFCRCLHPGTWVLTSNSHYNIATLCFFDGRKSRFQLSLVIQGCTKI